MTEGHQPPSFAVPRSIAGCFAQQNIGEVARSDGGVNSMDMSKIQAVTEKKSSIDLSPAMFHSFTKQYRGEELQKKRLIVECIPLALRVLPPYHTALL